MNKTHGQFKRLFKTQFEGLFKGSFLYILFMFYGSIRALTEAIYKWFYFSSVVNI